MKIAGHIIGGIAIGLFFLSYQISQKKKLLIVQTMATSCMCLQYLLLGAYAGFASNIVCITRNILFYYRKKDTTVGKWMPVVLAVIMGFVSLLGWDGYYSIFVMVGLMINTLCMGYCEPQGLRKSVLFTCVLIILYDIFSGSYAGAVSESLSIVSAAIGIVRYRKGNTEETK